MVVVAACGDDAATPDFPADYADTFTEVRDCRPSGDHDLHHVRVLADAVAAPPYLGRDAPFPDGAIVLKEEYGFADDACEDEIVAWTVMTRITGSPETLGWRWQKVASDLTVISEDDSRCIGCHLDCGVPPDGYDGTCEVP